MAAYATSWCAACNTFNTCVRQVMARYIDDISFSTIRELILLNNVEIIAHIQSDTAFLQKLFQVRSRVECKSSSSPRVLSPGELTCYS